MSTSESIQEAVLRALLRSYGFRDDDTPLVDFIESSLRHLGAMNYSDRQLNAAARDEDEVKGEAWVPLARVVAGALPGHNWQVARNVALSIELAYKIRPEGGDT